MNSADNTIFPKGDKAPPDYFTGTAWVKVLLPNDTDMNCQIVNVVFEPGARNNWHTHSGGQILIATEGTGYYQEKGKPIQVLHKGDVVRILPDVLHWHGAAPLYWRGCYIRARIRAACRHGTKFRASEG